MAEYRALHEAWEGAHERQILYSGIIAAEVRNTLRSERSDRVWTAADWLPKQQASAPPEESEQDRIERLRLKAMAINAMMGGKFGK